MGPGLERVGGVVWGWGTCVGGGGGGTWGGGLCGRGKLNDEMR